VSIYFPSFQGRIVESRTVAYIFIVLWCCHWTANTKFRSSFFLSSPFTTPPPTISFLFVSFTLSYFLSLYFTFFPSSLHTSIIFYFVPLSSFPSVLLYPVRGVDHPHSSRAEVKERVELYLYSPSGSSWPLLGWNLPLPFCLYLIYPVTRYFTSHIVLVYRRFTRVYHAVCRCFTRSCEAGTATATGGLTPSRS
jgi:hypothetical protein